MEGEVKMVWMGRGNPNIGTKKKKQKQLDSDQDLNVWVSNGRTKSRG